MMDIKSLFVWALGSVIRVIRLISTLKKNYLLRTFQPLGSWPLGSRVITGFFQLLGSLGSMFFLYISCLNHFCPYFQKSSVNGIVHKGKWQKSETYIRNQTYKRFVWMAAPISYLMAWRVGAKLICLCISFLHYLDQRINDPFFQTNSP